LHPKPVQHRADGAFGQASPLGGIVRRERTPVAHGAADQLPLPISTPPLEKKKTPPSPLSGMDGVLHQIHRSKAGSKRQVAGQPG